jgi:hypothetical protein
MKFQDPFQTACPSCGIQGKHSVRTLLALQARCPACGSGLETLGREMKAQLVQWSAYIGKIEAAILLEKQLGISINDPELDAAETGMDLVALVRTKLAAPISETRNVPEVVRAAITATRRTETSLEQLYLPLEKLLADLSGEG